MNKITAGRVVTQRQDKGGVWELVLDEAEESKTHRPVTLFVQNRLVVSSTTHCCYGDTGFAGEAIPAEQGSIEDAQAML